MKKVRQSYAGLILAAVLAMALSVFCPMAGWAEDPIPITPGSESGADAVLYPGYIKGTASLGDMSNTTVRFYYGGVRASTSANGQWLNSYFDLSNIPSEYQLTVHIPDKNTQIYKPYLSVSYMDGGYLYFESAPVTVYYKDKGAPSVVNLTLNPAYISGQISATTCGSLKSGSIEVSSAGFSTQVYFGTDGKFRFPVKSDTPLTITGEYYLSNGWKYQLTEKKVTIGAGKDFDPAWQIEQCPAGCSSATLGGDVGIEGLGNNTLVSYNMNLIGSTQKNLVIPANGPYKMEGLKPGPHQLYVSAYLNRIPGTNEYYYDDQYDDVLYIPNADYTYMYDEGYPYYNLSKIDLNYGTNIKNVKATAAFVNGRISFAKDATVVAFKTEQTAHAVKVTAGKVLGYGIFGTRGSYSDRNGYSRDIINADNGNFDMIATEGEWNVFHTELNFSYSQPMDLCGDGKLRYIDSRMTVYDYSRTNLYNNSNQLVLSGGQSVDNFDFKYETGALTIRFRVDGGDKLSSPYVSAYYEESSQITDSKGQKLVRNDRTYSLYASGKPTSYEVPATEGEVTLIGPPGVYRLSSIGATVNGASTSFGQMQVEIFPGSCQIIEIGAPTLTLNVTNTCNSEVAVNGKATDKMSPIQSVKINGEIIGFTATGNADNEVTFNIRLPLKAGENKIRTEVTNNSGKTASDSRTVNSYSAGTFVVGDEGLVNIDWLYDGGKYQGQFGIFSLDGMGQFTPGSPEFITEVTNRVLSNTEKGYLVFSDLEEGARFSGILGNEIKDWNAGDYKGVKSFAMKPGSCFATVLIPNSTFASVAQNPATTDANKRPLFSLVSANPAYGMSMGQMADVNGMGKAYSYEDKDAATSDRDFNDLIVMITGATADLPSIDDLKSQRREKRDYGDWRDSDFGRLIMAHVESAAPINPITVTLKGSATLLVYDAQGKVIGKSGGTLVGADFAMTADSQTVTLPDGSYRIVIQGVKAETCLLSVKDSQGNLKEIQVDTALHQVFGTSTALETPTASASYDFNGDGITDNTDVEMLVKHWNSCRGQQKYDPFFDVNDDGCITVADIMTVLNAKTVK